MPGHNRAQAITIYLDQSHGYAFGQKHEKVHNRSDHVGFTLSVPNRQETDRLICVRQYDWPSEE
ncbi:hypothetical protein GZ78_22430 [Endozoicomonas numazuensis]|uniref:Uncharacterized protein n=1 Tax=Endozoicomonas numazuensis TaxID=1137799 RepID=A0A081NDR7_9GAMM|nr:hypothetical protein GZ78_22430 [Endozoicomonas numazuensis]